MPAIKVKNLSKVYRIGLNEKVEDTITGKVISLLKAPITNFKNLRKLQEFKLEKNESDFNWALKNISFEVKTGEVLGIVGPNGAGKSTLLKLLSQITKPTSGSAELNGRVASLLEVGTGFHPDLTGRENIFLNGTILGMKKHEIEGKFHDIIDFSGIGKFIDTPVKRYSSGMRVRLAFSVAAFLEPEILLIDEVLAVGDINFQNKCLEKMESISKSKRTILFVSHNLPSIKKLCTRALLIDKGKLVEEGSVDKIISEYIRLNQPKNDDAKRLKTNNSFYKDMDILVDNKKTNTIQTGANVTFRTSLAKQDLDANLIIIFKFKTIEENILFHCLSSNSHDSVFNVNSDSYIDLIIPQIPLPPGRYIIELTIKDGGKTLYKNFFEKKINVVKGDFFNTGKLNDGLENAIHGILVPHKWFQKN